jgi:hypothetical protein
MEATFLPIIQLEWLPTKAFYMLPVLLLASSMSIIRNGTKLGAYDLPSGSNRCGILTLDTL